MPRQLPRMVRAELRKLLSRGMGRAGLVVAAAVALMAVGGLEAIHQAREGVSVNGASPAELIRFEVAVALEWALRARNFFVMPLVLLTLAAQSLAGEWGDRTLRALVLRPVPRWSVVLAKLAALLAYSALTLAVTFAVALLASLGLFTRELPLGGVALGYLATCLADLGLCALALLVGTALRSVTGVIVGVMLALMADRALALALTGAAFLGAGWADAAGDWLPGTALGAWSGFSEGWSPRAFMGLAALTAGCLGLTVWRFQRADVP